MSQRVFFVKQKTAYEMRISDWSSDVCSSDLSASGPPPHGFATGRINGWFRSFPDDGETDQPPAHLQSRLKPKTKRPRKPRAFRYPAMSKRSASSDARDGLIDQRLVGRGVMLVGDQPRRRFRRRLGGRSAIGR